MKKEIDTKAGDTTRNEVIQLTIDRSVSIKEFETLASDWADFY